MPVNSPRSRDASDGPGQAASQFCPLRFALCILTCLFLSYLAFPQESAPERIAAQDGRVSSAVVQLLAVGPAEKEQNRECSGTGFLIDEEGYLITNAHVVENAKRCLERAPGAKILAKLTISDMRTAPAVPCDVVALDEPNDLALLKAERPLVRTPGERPPYAPLDARAVAVGTAVGVTGYPAFSWQPVTQAGHVTWSGRTRLEEIDNPLPNASDAVEIDVHLRPGNSGSPVYRTGGGVIAVIDKRDALQPDHSIAVAIHYAIELAERHKAPWHAPE